MTLDTLPVLDGKLDDAVWAKAVEFTPFYFVGQDRDSAKKPFHATEGRIYLTKEYWVFGMKCYESDMAKSKLFANIKEHDGAIWNDDCVEIRVAPDVERSAMRYPYYAFLFNQLGVSLDMLVKNDTGAPVMLKKWESKSKVAVYKDEKYWSIEVLIPFADMPGAAAAKKWRFQLSRYSNGSGEYSVAIPMPPAKNVTDELYYGALKIE